MQSYAEAAAWQEFPWGLLITLSATATTLILYALVEYLRKKFFSREEANEMGKTLRKSIASLGKDLDELETRCGDALRLATESYRKSELLDRAQAEQWERVTEEIIRPVREMAREIRETRELVIEYMGTQKSQQRDIERLERIIDGKGKG
jgi:hypothetical protein